MKVGILLVTFAVSWCPISCRNRPFICNNASEPTFGEIFQLLSPAGIDLTTPPSYQSSNSFPDILINVWGNIFSQVSQSFYSIKFPLAYLVSDGVFTLSHVSDHYGDLLADAVIIKEKHWSQRLICSLARRFAPSHSLSTFCGCWSGLSLLQYYGERRAKDYLPGMSEHDWCVVTEPCQGQFSSSDLHCRIVVDPLTSACVASSKFSLHADPRLEQIVSYRLEVRTLKTQNWDETISLTFLKLCHSLNVPQLRESCYSIYDYSHLHIIPFICQTIPIYIVNALIAVTFLSIEDSVASHPLLRFVVAVVLGLILALIWALVVLYRLSHKIFNVEGIPFVGNLIQPGITAIFLGFSVMFTSSTIQQYLLDQILVFWRDGCFGIPWLGKVYFFLSVGLSLIITYRYGMFVEGTFSHTLLRLLLRSLGGVMLFLRCSPNADICIALGISALLRDYILELSHYLWITFEASKQSPSYIYSGQRPLTDDDYSHQGQIHTAAALKELRDYLQTPEGKAQSAKVSYRWREARRDDLSLKLDQFTKGLYSGRPYDDEATNENDENEPLISQKSWSQTLFTLLTYSLVCLSLSCIIAFVVFDVGSMDNTGTSSFLSRTRTFLESIGVLQRTNPDL